MASISFPQQKPSKYNAKRVVIDGMTFASKREGNRYAELKLLQRIGEIVELECQPRYPLTLNGVKLATYVADFRYRDVASGEIVVEDVKSKPTITDVYRLKKKLMLALHGISLKEVF
jgi:hypothetical protein